MNIQTVLGPIPVEKLGRTLMHEHIFISFEGSQYDPTAVMNRDEVVDESVKRLKALKAAGVDTFVDPCPIELGRDVLLMAEISERSEMNVICATGFYHETMGLPAYWRQRTVEEIAALYIDEIERGVGSTGIRCGIIKCATGAPAITEMEFKFLAATSLAHKATGVPIVTHTQSGVLGPEQQDEFEKHGVPLNRALIGHCCNSSDQAYHRRIASRGTYIGFDRIGMTHYFPDEVRADGVLALIEGGFGAQVMLSQDRFCAWHGKPYVPLTPAQEAVRAAQKAAGDWPPPHTYIVTHFLPMLRARGLNEDDIHLLLNENPRRLFAGEPMPAVVPRKIERVAA